MWGEQLNYRKMAMLAGCIALVGVTGCSDPGAGSNGGGFANVASPVESSDTPNVPRRTVVGWEAGEYSAVVGQGRLFPKPIPFSGAGAGSFTVSVPGVSGCGDSFSSGGMELRRVAVVVERGGCTFREKVDNAIEVGYGAVLIVGDDPAGWVLSTDAMLSIPVLSVSSLPHDGEVLELALDPEVAVVEVNDGEVQDADFVPEFE